MVWGLVGFTLVAIFIPLFCSFAVSKDADDRADSIFSAMRKEITHAKNLA